MSIKKLWTIWLSLWDHIWIIIFTLVIIGGLIALVFGGIEWYKDYKFEKFTELSEEGDRLSNIGSYKLSNNAYQKALEYNKESSNTYYKIAGNFLDMKQYQQSLDNLNKSLSLPGSAYIGTALFYHRAIVYNNIKSYDLAIKDWDRVIIDLEREAEYSYVSNPYDKRQFKDKIGVSSQDIRDALKETIYGTTLSGYKMLANAIFYKAYGFEMIQKDNFKLLENHLWIYPESELFSLDELKKRDPRDFSFINEESKNQIIGSMDRLIKPKYTFWEQILIGSKYLED